MSQKLIARLAFEVEDTARRLKAAAEDLGLQFADEWDLSAEVPDADRKGLLVVEDRSDPTTLLVRTQSLVAAEPDALVVVVVPHPREVSEEALREAGAFDVIDDGDDLPRQLARTVAMARRFAKLESERAALGADLAHRERLSALGLLAAGVGHEVNNPCAAILANATVVRDQLESLLSRPRYQQVEALTERAGDWLEALGDCIGASRRITSIVKTLHVFSRRTPEMEPEPVQLNDAVATVLRLVGKEVRYQADVELDLEEGLPFVMAPPHALTQVLTNLVVNALQALENSPGRKCVTIRTTADDDSVMLEVTDTGPGVAPEHLGRIFDPFFTTKTGQGMGLGLAITRETVLRAGGDIFAESEPGRGARFRVVMPRPPESVGRRRTPSILPTSERLRVMIVDDDDMLLRSMARSLRDRFECISVNSVPAALKSLADDDRIDVLVADIVMPGENGIDLYEHLLRVHPHVAARTVFFSGGVSSETLQAAIERTGRPLLGKPVDLLELVRTVRDVAA